MKFKNILIIFFFLCFILNFKSTFAQFGKNKVQYKEFKWEYLQTKHFDIYFTQDGYDLAEFTATVAESSLESLTKNLDYNILNRIPIIVFNSHNDFQQNNVIEEYMPEGVGGVTELFKNRVLVPFEGNYEQFKHVIHHELTHAYLNDLFYGGSIQNVISKNITLRIPTWFNEGMAEFQSLNGMDKNTDSYICDLILNNLLPPIEYCDGYLAYRGGQSFLSFLSDTYGHYKIGELVNNIRSLNDVNGGFQETYKLDLEKLNDKWQKEIKKTYWPEIKYREDVLDFAKALTDHTKDGGFYNVSPVISPMGDKFAFISNRDDFFDVFIANTNTGEIINKVISGNTTSNFEELQVLTPGLCWSPDGKKLAISVKAGKKDAVFIINAKNGDEEKLKTDLDIIYYVTWSPADKNLLAFIGSKANESDIYTYNLLSNKIENITNDVFSDYNPVFSPDGKYIYFTSDRGNYTKPDSIPANFKIVNYDLSNRNIYKIELSTKEMTKVTDEKNSKLGYMQFSADGSKMLYVSDVSGISNIYLRETDSSGKIINKPITNSLSPLDQISLSKDGKKLLFNSLNKGGYDIYSMDRPFDRKLKIDSIESTDFVKQQLLNKNESSDSLVNLAKSLDTLELNIKDSSLISISPGIDSVLKTTKKTDSLSIYGNDIKINFKTNKADSLKRKLYNTDSNLYTDNNVFKITGNQNSDGSFKVNKYKIKFSPDLVYGNVNYSSFYGVNGIAQISLSDMLGNHRINILTSMVIDLKNSDYAISYYYLPKRIDYGFQIYHTARFIYFDNGVGTQLYRFRNYGGNLNIQFPFTKFNRFEGALSFMNVSRENLDDSNEPIASKFFIVPSLSFVHDNSLFGYISPIKGTRYNLTLLNSPKLSSAGLEFTSVLGDFRTYFKLGEGYSFAMRFAGGASFGANPQLFWIGGTENWLNYRFEKGNMPYGKDIEAYTFSMPGLPLRGYNFDRMSGSKYALTNLELRFPLFRYLILGLLPIGFQDIQGNLFIDAGTAWSDTKSLKLFAKDSSGTFRTQDLLVGTGMGTRIVMFGFPLKFDVAWSFDMNRFSPPKYYISLGLDF
jgi:Tol biopolymer transport system component